GVDICGSFAVRRRTLSLDGPPVERSLAAAIDPVCRSSRTNGNDLRELGAAEAQPDAVVCGDSRRKAVVDELAVARPAAFLAVVVRARAPGEEAEPVSHPFQLRAERVGDAGLEPADHSRAPAGHH